MTRLRCMVADGMRAFRAWRGDLLPETTPVAVIESWRLTPKYRITQVGEKQKRAGLVETGAARRSHSRMENTILSDQVQQDIRECRRRRAAAQAAAMCGAESVPAFLAAVSFLEDARKQINAGDILDASLEALELGLEVSPCRQ